MPIYRFEAVWARARRRVACPVCGRKRNVQRTFEQTVNPFHDAVKELGPTATYDEHWKAVARSLRFDAEAWQPTVRDSAHEKCRPEVSDAG